MPWKKGIFTLQSFEFEVCWHCSRVFLSKKVHFARSNGVEKKFLSWDWWKINHSDPHQFSQSITMHSEENETFLPTSIFNDFYMKISCLFTFFFNQSPFCRSTFNLVLFLDKRKDETSSFVSLLRIELHFLKLRHFPRKKGLFCQCRLIKWCVNCQINFLFLLKTFSIDAMLLTLSLLFS